MSYVSYLGLSKDLESNLLKEKEYQFILENTVVEESIRDLLNRPYIYECMTLSEGPITFDWNDELFLYNKKFIEESVAAFLDVCHFLRNNLESEETAIFYAMWQHDLSGAIIEQEIDLNDFQIKNLKISHQTLLVLRK